MKVAVVRNASRRGVVFRAGRPSPERYGKRSVLRVVEALREGGHDVELFEGDTSMFAELERFMPPAPHSGAPTGLVVNLAYGIQGDARYTHVPAMLELAGIPYTGASPLGHAVSLDKIVTKTVLLAAGVPTPPFAVHSGPGQPLGAVTLPCVVKPRHESTSVGLHLVADRGELDEAVADVVERFDQEALVEQYVDGREICIGLLGNEPVTVLPAVELDFGVRALRLVTRDDKYHETDDEPEKLCPATLEPELLDRLNELAIAAFHACHVRDYARVDFRLDASGAPYVLEINSMASLGPGGSYVRAAAAAGLDFTALVNGIVEIASARYARMGAPVAASS
jgi:D-alanine-D-alanine ligase